MISKEQLREEYLAYLAEEVTYGHNKRARVRHPKKYEKIAVCKGQEILDRNVWVWSDLHFFHKNIILFSDRPYPDVKTMNEHLVANFNDYVGEDDVSIWVGDVGMNKSLWINELLDKCNGYKILVVGNHDFDGKKLMPLKFDEIHLIYHIDFQDVSLVFTHYPWTLPKPFINIHGHTHIGCVGLETVQHINVNCEFHEYKPINLQTIHGWAKSRLLEMEG